MSKVYTVLEGDWDKIRHYGGTSVFFAGLAMARARRVLRPWSMSGMDSLSIETDHADDESTGLTDEEFEFFEACKDLGARRYESAFATARRERVDAEARARWEQRRAERAS